MPSAWIVRARRCLAALPLVLAPACTLTMDTAGPPVVQRPTFSTTTATTPRGGLSLEIGADSGPKSRLGVPTTFRWGAGPDTEVTIGGLLHQRSAEGRTGIGDLEIGTLICNAAREPQGPFLGIGLDDHLNTLDVNCRAPMVLAHALGRRMLERKRGAIVDDLWWRTVVGHGKRVESVAHFLEKRFLFARLRRPPV